MSEDVLITVMFPVYENVSFFRKTISSLLNQNVVDFKWNILVLDWRDDEKVKSQSVIDLVDNKKVLYYRCNNMYSGSIYECINSAARLVNSEWISVITNYYVFKPNYIEYMGKIIGGLELFAKRKIGAISTQYKTLRMDIESDDIEVKVNENIYAIPDVDNFDKIRYFDSHYERNLGNSKLIIPENAALYRRDVFLEVDGYNHNYAPVQTDVLFSEIMKKYKICVLYKECGVNISINSIYDSKENVIKAARMWREYLLRKSNKKSLTGIDKYAYFRFIRKLIQRHMSMKLNTDDFIGVMPEKISVTKYLFYYYFIVHYYEKKLDKQIIK